MNHNSPILTSRHQKRQNKISLKNNHNWREKTKKQKLKINGNTCPRVNQVISGEKEGGEAEGRREVETATAVAKQVGVVGLGFGLWGKWCGGTIIHIIKQTNSNVLYSYHYYSIGVEATPNWWVPSPHTACLSSLTIIKDASLSTSAVLSISLSLLLTHGNYLLLPAFCFVLSHRPRFHWRRCNPMHSGLNQPTK